MEVSEALPPEFLKTVKELESSYLKETDPIKQSGFGGGPKRWREEREPILDACKESDDLLDVGCANGYLLECLIAWGHERGLELSPYGVDINPRLIKLAQERLPIFKEHFFVANAWDWQPQRRFQYVYALSDCVPDTHLEAFIERLLNRVVEPKGTLILGNYGSRLQNLPIDFSKRLAQTQFVIQGSRTAGTPPTSSFAWLVKA